MFNDTTAMPTIHAAFHGAADLKQATVDRARTAGAEGRLRALPARYDQEADRGSPFALLLRSSLLELSEPQLGIPEPVAVLYESLFFGFLDLRAVSGRAADTIVPAAAPLLADWLAAVPPGANLALLPNAFMARMLRTLHGNGWPVLGAIAAPVGALLQDVARLHERVVAGDAPTAAEWSGARRAALAVTDATGDAMGHAVATLAESVIWPPAEARRALPEAVIEFLNGMRQALMLLPYTAEQMVLRQRAGAAIDIALQADPKPDGAALQRLPEVMAWEAECPQERQQQIASDTSGHIAALCLTLHRELVALPL